MSKQTNTVIGYPVAAATTSASANRRYDYESEEEDDDDESCSPRNILGVTAAIISQTFFPAVLLYIVITGESDPHSKTPQFLVDSASFSQHNSTASNLTASWLIYLRVKNPNSDMSLFYDRFHAYVIFGGQSEPPLDVTWVKPFHQEKLGESIVKLQFRMVSKFVGEAVVKGVTSEAWARRYVEFGVLVKSSAEYAAWQFRSVKEDLLVFCDSVRFELSRRNGTASFMGPSRKCQVERNS